MYEFWKYYDVFPKVVLADQVSVIRVHPRFGHAAFPEPDKIRIRILPLDGLCPDGSFRYAEAPGCVLNWSLESDGSLRIEAMFAGEQEHNLTIELTPPVWNGEEWRRKEKELLRFNLYSVGDDLLALRPFKGDFHMHSCRSDGLESPDYVAARNRELGLDFIAISDHHRYAPSLEAIDAWKKLPTDLKLYPGEEVHAPDNPVHIINFGGSFSVNELARRDEARYRREVESKALPFPVGASEWVFDRIREGGGLAVFCHPYWQMNQYEISEAVTSEILNRRKFDALELLGGFYPWQWRSNNFQLARFMEERARGNSFPVVGLSDAHGTDCGELAGWYYTVVLAKSDSLSDLVDAMRAGRCVAVSKVSDNPPQVLGEFRLVKFISFLVESYFPRHDEMCAAEGRLMVDALGGDGCAVAALKALKGRCAAYCDACYGKRK